MQICLGVLDLFRLLLFVCNLKLFFQQGRRGSQPEKGRRRQERTENSTVWKRHLVRGRPLDSRDLSLKVLETRVFGGKLCYVAPHICAFIQIQLFFRDCLRASTDTFCHMRGLNDCGLDALTFEHFSSRSLLPNGVVSHA